MAFDPVTRVRTILVLGYWVLGNIHRYWAVLVIGGYFLLFWHQIQYRSGSSRQHPHAGERLLFSSACDLYSDRRNHLSGPMLICCCLLNIIIVIIMEFWDFSWSLLCYTLISVLVFGIGIARGQYYWVLDIGCLSWYRSNATGDPTRPSCWVFWSNMWTKNSGSLKSNTISANHTCLNDVI